MQFERKINHVPRDFGRSNPRFHGSLQKTLHLMFICDKALVFHTLGRAHGNAVVLVPYLTWHHGPQGGMDLANARVVYTS